MSDGDSGAHAGPEIGRALELARKERGLSFKQVEEATKIRAGYLEELERENFDVLPAVYVQGSLKTYANFLQLDGEALVQQLKRRQASQQESQELVAYVEPKKSTSLDPPPVALAGAAGVESRGVIEDEAEKPDPHLTLAPRLADGVELLGEYENSGFKETPYLAQRADGQVVQLSRLLYLVASEADGRLTAEQIAERVSRQFGRTVSGENVEFLAEKKLRPLGVLAQADGSSLELARASPFLALTFRAALVPARAVTAITALLWPLFLPPVVVAVLLAFGALDAWLFFVHGLGGGVREILYQPELFLLVLGLAVLSGAFHECGHATACRYGGARPRAIGVGIYLVWPVFYADVTDIYRLGRGGRLRADLGGVYFNAIFSLATAAAYFATGAESLLVVVLLQQIEILYQFFPFLRLDGYYIVSDLTGVPDLFTRIKPILKSMVPGWGTDKRVEELKPWVRVVVAAWVVTVIPVLLYLLAMLVVSAPLILTSAWDSIVAHYGEVREAFGDGKVVDGVAGLLRIVLLVIPAAGMILTLALVGKHLGAVFWSWLGRKDQTFARNEALVRRYFRDLCGRRNLDSADELIARDCTLHDPGFPQEVRGPEGVKRYVDTTHHAALLEDTRFTVEDRVVEGDMMAVRWTCHGAHDDKGFAPARGNATFTGITSFRITDGKIAQIWEDYDALGELHASSSSNEGQQTFPSFRVVGKALGAYIGIPAVLLFPIGLITLTLQLVISEHLRFLTAGYAATLIPVTVIVGQGIAVLLVPLFASFVVSLAAAHFRVWQLLKIREKVLEIPTEVGRRTRRTRLSFAGVMLFLVATAVFALWFTSVSCWQVADTSSLVGSLPVDIPCTLLFNFANTLSLTLAVMVGLWSGILIAGDYIRHPNRSEHAVLLGKRWIWRGVQDRWIIRGLLWAYLGSALLAVLAFAAFGQGSFLPRVMISTSGEEARAPNEAPPLLLSHSHGYWHILNSTEGEGAKDDNYDEGAISSIADGNVEHVAVIKDPVADLALTVEGLRRDDVAWVSTILTYELKVTNNGPEAATDVKIADKMSKNAELVSITPSRGTCSNKVVDGERSFECELGNLAKEDVATVRIEVKPEAARSLLNNTATVESEGFDYYEENGKETSSVEVKLDPIVPETRSTVLPKANPRGWNESDVTVSLRAEDHEGSGVEEIVYRASGAQEIEKETVKGDSAEVSLASEGKTTIYYSAKDAAGNTESETSVTVGIDKTGPNIDCDTDDLWHKEDVNIPCTASDSMSGLSAPTYVNFSLSTKYARERVEDGEENDNASTNSRKICDVAGNCTTAGPIGGIKIDKKGPSVKIIAPPDGAEYKLNEHVDADYACLDGGSGVDACYGSVSEGSGINTSSVGPQIFKVEAKDNAENTTLKSHAYSITYDFASEGSVRLAKDPSELYVTRAGGTVLVRFSLGGDQGSDIFAAGYPLSKGIECPEQASHTTITESKGDSKRLLSPGQYTYAWDTNEAWSGTCRQLVLKLNDGTEYLANFKFK